MTATLTPVVLSTDYYLDTVTFKVEDTIYKVLRKPFTDSSVVFRDMLSIAQAEAYEGIVDDKPIILDGVKKKEWESLLYVLLKQKDDFPSDGAFSAWTAILELSRRWIMKDVHAKARAKLEGFLLTPSALITHGRNFQCSKWLSRGVRMIITRPASEVIGIHMEEARLMSLDQLLELFRMRERWQTGEGYRYEDEPDGMADEVIRKQFGKEMEELDAVYANIFSEEKSHQC